MRFCQAAVAAALGARHHLALLDLAVAEARVEVILSALCRRQFWARLKL